MLQLCLLKKLIMSSSQLEKLPMPALSQPTRWSSVTQDMASTWPAAFSTEETWSPRMSMLPLPPSRPREASSLWTGVQLASRSESTTSHQPSSLEVTRPRFREPSVCSPTPPLSPRPGPGLTTSLTSCMLREPLFTGMLVRVWRRESSLRLEKILLLLRRIMKRSVLTLLMLEMMLAKNIKCNGTLLAIVWFFSKLELHKFGKINFQNFK